MPLAVAKYRLLEYLRLGDLETLASAAYGEGVAVFTKAGVGGLSKTVAIQSIPAYQRGATTVIPLRWVATGPLGGAFPVLDANIELTATDAGSELLLVGSYRPPFGSVGVALDRLLLHNVGQSTVRRFAAQLAEIASSGPAPIGVLGPEEPTPDEQADPAG